MVSLIFVHSALDDADLTASQFRVYAHLARRADGEGRARPGIESIAETCKLHPDTARAAIKTLVARHMLDVQERPGLARIYVLTPPDKWTAPPEKDGGAPPRKEAPPSIPTPPKAMDHTPPNPREDTPPKAMETKVLPVKVLPVKADAAVGEFLRKADVWTRCRMLLNYPDKRRSYEEEEALAHSADLTDHEMRQIERIHAIAANSPEKRIHVRRKLVPLLRDLPGELALAAQHGLNGKSTLTITKAPNIPAEWPAFLAHLQTLYPAAEAIKRWASWADADDAGMLTQVKENYREWKEKKP